MNPLARLAASLKAFRMSWAGGSGSRWWSGYGRSRYNYRAEVGDGRGNSIVQATVLWVCRTFPEAPVRVSTIGRDGSLNPVDNHPLKLLLDTPNPYYSGELLWASTLSDWMISGNAYWVKVRSLGNRVVQLWWVPSTMMEPKWPDDGSSFLSHYEYTPNAEAIRIETADVIHFRYLVLDPNNPRKGMSPIASILREIFTDDEAAAYTAAMLRNVGVPPVVISPGKDARPTKDELEEIKDGFIEKTTGDRRGEPMVMRGETHVTVLGFNPSQMDLRNVRGIPEERVSALYGIPAAVVGLGSGLANSKVGATMAEFREQAYENMIIPTQRLLAGELRTQLLPDFGDPQRLKVDFDLTQVRVLQDDQNALHERVREDLKAGLITLAKAQEMLGEDPDPNGDVYYLPTTITVTPADQIAVEPEPAFEVVEEQPALPAPKLLKLPGGRKSAGDIADALQRLRMRLQPTARRRAAALLKDQQNRVVERLTGTSKAAGDVPDPGSLLPPEEEARIRLVLEALHRRTLEGVHLLVEDALSIAFDLDDPTTREFLADAGVMIRDIHQTTLEAVRAALQAGQAEGESLAQLAERIKDLPAFNAKRAMLVARTELGRASNLAAAYSYRASGAVVGIRVLDGDFDGACAAINGRTFSLDDIPPALAHPNCTRAFLPLTDPSQLEDAA